MAGEWCASTAASAAGKLAMEYASFYLSYFFYYGKIVNDFNNLRAELEMKKDRLKNDVDEAIRQTEVIEKDVVDWLAKAEKVLVEAQSLAGAIVENKCFNWCPNWGWQFCLSRKVAKKTLDISKLLEISNFTRVGYRAPLQGIEFLLPNDFMCFESSKLALDGIMKALNRDDVNMIGLYGMPGVGKTTLAKEVGRQATQRKLFDKVVTVTVSQTPNINKIQDRLAEVFGLKFVTSTEEGRAEELWRRLNGEMKIFIIVDDIWKEIKLQTIGIPIISKHHCKILLTTRVQQVCIKMNCQETFQLNILSEDEAWTLFKNHASLKDASGTFIDVAKDVVRECKGLPLAIVTMGKALKGETLDAWRATNQRLKNSRHLDNQDVCEGIYSCLKLSYDYLKEDNIQTLFLLCSLFPEDHNISIEILTLCGIGLGLFSNIYLIEELRREICVALTKLQKFGLLLESDGERFVRMHDVVRDFAHWLTLSGKNKFMAKDGLIEWPMSESFECYAAISLWNSKIKDFPDKLQFPKLKTLLLMGNNSLSISSMFFEGMKFLRVLVLEGVVFSLEALQFLPKLRTLRFNWCELIDISLLRYVENLEILAFFHTNIQELPKELLGLCRLKSLYVSYSEKTIFPPYLIPRLASLQELHVKSENNFNILELKSLSRLSALTLQVSTNQCFQENFVFPKLQRYYISVNNDMDMDWPLRRLDIDDFSYSFNAFKELFCNVEKLALSNVREHKNIVPNIDEGGMNALISLKLIFCKDLECLIDTTREQGPIAAFSNLVDLEMFEMDCLEELCHGQTPVGFLQELKDVSINLCRQLQSLFQMNWILAEEESPPLQLFSKLTSLDLYFLPELESIWKEPIAQPAGLESLKVVIIKCCNKLKSIFPARLTYSLLHLQQLEIFECDGLEQIFDFAKELSSLDSDATTIYAELEENQASPLSNLACLELDSLPELRFIWRSPHIFNLQSLRTIRIQRCGKLLYLFSYSLARTLEHLEDLKIVECDSLEHLIEEENCYPLCWPYLKTLQISCCESMKYVFPISLAQGLQHLETVEITDCPQLMQVFNTEKGKFSWSMSSSLKQLKVQNCPLLNCPATKQGVPSHARSEILL